MPELKWADRVEQALAGDPDEKLIEILSDRCDQPYYDSGEAIADRHSAYIRANRGSIHLRKGSGGRGEG